MPFPSAACKTCKARRIKCDEGKPICQRCLKSKRECVPATAAKQGSIVIHSENDFASGETKRPRGPRSTLRIWRPKVDVQTVALAYYLQSHFQALKDIPGLSTSLSECVTMWRETGRSSSMVDLAFTSIALAIFSRIQKNEEAAHEATTAYSRLIRITRQCIDDLGTIPPKQHEVDACLLTVSLMGRYEAVVHRASNGSYAEQTFSQIRTWPHHDGALAILKFWYNSKGRRSPSFIIKQIRRGLVKSCLLRNLKIPEWMVNGEEFGEDGHELAYDKINVRAVDLHYEYVRLERQTEVQVPLASELASEAIKLEMDLRDWTKALCPGCHGKRHVLTEIEQFPIRNFYSPIVQIYEQPNSAGAWGQVLATRLLVVSTHLRLLKLVRPKQAVDFDYEQQRLDCIVLLQILSDRLASAIPCCLEKVKADESGSVTVSLAEPTKPYFAGLMVWPLSIASSLGEIDAGQRAWFRSELSAIGRIIGEGVIESAETGEWASL